MANIKSAKKKAQQDIKRTKVNLARKTAVKTAIKKVVTALENNASETQITELFNVAQAHIARAKNKGLLHRNTAARKISRLAQRIATENK
jgi:small subunit ribosomal protein S20